MELCLYISCVPFTGQHNNRDSCANHYDCSDMSDLILKFSARGIYLTNKLSEKTQQKMLQI